jgi:hypothetical protein
MARIILEIQQSPWIDDQTIPWTTIMRKHRMNQKYMNKSCVKWDMIPVCGYLLSCTPVTVWPLDSV